MPQVVSVRFRYNPKPLWFDPQGKLYEPGAEVLVETERGREVGHILDPAIEATDKQIDKLKSPLKPVVRALNDLDYEHLDALEEKGKSAMPYFRERVEHYKLDIKPVEVQYLFSGERAIFYFSSEERVDFRELVRDLAQHFHVRIDMRQIGARDEAKELGGIAHCGEEFCCTRFGGEFQPVSIRMAKEQDLPLNPTKISGVCGRLMCCLRYEYDAYKDFKKRAPKTGTIVDTPLGEAVISGYNTPSETMELKLEDGNRFRVPLAEMNCQKGKEGCTRCSVSHETVERCASRNIQLVLNSIEQRLEDTLAPDTDSNDADLKVNIGSGARRPRRRSSGSKQSSSVSARGGEQQKKQQPNTETNEGARGSDGTRKRRKRRSDASTGQNQQTQQPSTQKKQNKPVQDASDNTTTNKTTTNKAAANKATTNKTTANKPRPGQRSSGLRKRSNNNTRGSSQGASDKTNKQSNAGNAEQAPQNDTRKRRRRHTGTSTSTGDSTGSTGTSAGTSTSTSDSTGNNPSPRE